MSRAPTVPAVPDEPTRPAGAREHPALRAGRFAWAALGIALLAAVVVYLGGMLSIVIVPLVIALFPAALLAPVSSWLKRHGLPHALAALLTLLGGLAILVGATTLFVSMVVTEAPDLAEGAGEGLRQFDRMLQGLPFDIGVDDLDDLGDRASQWLETAGEQLFSAAAVIVEGVVATLFGLVALFFYLKDGDRLAAGLRETLPAGWRADATELARRAWYTLGRYFRGQLLVAFVDAFFIGVGLLLLGVPLALPLAYLVFIGGLFPIVGAFASGTLAVLVALADQGLAVGLAVLGLIIAVQQIESNVLEPIVLGTAVRLHPLTVIVALTAGAAVLGILGAFLAVPVAASIARALDHLRPDAPDRFAEEVEEATDD